MCEYARTAEDRELRVIIAGAGGAAHLPRIARGVNVMTFEFENVSVATAEVAAR